MIKQYATLESTIYFWFGANDTSGSGGDGASPAADVRLAGAAADAIPVLSPTPILLTHANYPAGCYEVAVAATTGNGFATNNTYAVFCTLAIDSQNPTGFVGSFDLKPVEANTKQVSGTSQTANDNGADINSILTDTGTTLDTLIKDIPTNAEFAALLGALDGAAADGDPTTTDTIMGYIKQLINILIGTSGIAAFPAEAAPNNAVSLAEVIRAIHADVTGLNGSAMVGAAPTVSEIQTEMEENGASLLDTIRDYLENGTYGLSALETLIDEVETILKNATYGLSAIRTRGDAAWVTGGGGAISDILNVQPLIPNAIDLANTATVRIGLGLTNMLDDLPGTAEITPGTITIDRKAIGGTSWTNIVNAAACSELTGLIYYDEVFDSGTGYAAGDTIRITFKSQKIVVAANDYEITGTDGWVFHTYVREAMVGTSGAYTGTPPTVSEIQAEMEEDGASLLDTIRDIVSHVTYGLSALKTLIDTNKTELDGLQGADGKCLISTDAQDRSGTLDVNTKTATATALNLILKDSTFALAIADAIWDEILTGSTHNIATSAGRRLREVGAFAIHSGIVQTGTSSSVTLAAAADANDGVYNRNLLVLVGGVGVGQTRTIVDYNGTTKVVVVDRDWRISPNNTTEYQIVPDDTPLIVDHGQVQAATVSTVKIREYASDDNNAYLCNIIAIIAGTGRGQARLVGSYNGTSKVVTLCGDNWVTVPDTTSIYIMIPYGTSCASCFDSHALGQIKSECDDALTGYDPPTRTEATADKDEVIAEVDVNETKIDTLQTGLTAVKAKTDDLPSGIAKNATLSDFTFYMVLSVDHVSEATGKILIGQISKDGGAFIGLINSITEIGNGLYKVDITQAEMNADVVTLKFTETDCDQRVIVIYPT